jgi:hypothetical protein
VHDRSIYAQAISPKFIIREYKQINLPTLTLIIVPTTRRRRYQTPSPGPLKGANATTTRKSWYYDAINQNPERKSKRQIADDCGISKGTG